MRPIALAVLLAALASPALADDDEDREDQAPAAVESPYATGDDEVAAQYGIGDPPHGVGAPPSGVGIPPSGGWVDGWGE